MKSPQIQRIERAILPTVEGLGFELIRVLLIGSGRQTLQIMAEKPDGTMLIDDCEKLSRAVSAVLDVEDVLDGAYYLEVSSPGIDRPLTRLKDFENYKGFDARVEMGMPVGKQKKFKGRLLGTEGENVRITDEVGVTHALPFDDIVKAKLLLTDDLVKAAQKNAK